MPFQSTPLRGAKVIDRGLLARRFAVSIHAPARGESLFLLAVVSRFQVSIHAPARGERPSKTRGPGGAGTFQSTPLRGAKVKACDNGAERMPFQSTPLRGAKEGRRFQWIDGFARFNPRPCAGRKGVCLVSFASRACCFNPRPCAGRKLRASDLALPTYPFQSTPLRGAKGVACLPVAAIATTFQSTPLRGAKVHGHPTLCTRGFVSIHAPARGERPAQPVLSAGAASFNPRPCAGRKAHRAVPHRAI